MKKIIIVNLILAIIVINVPIKPKTVPKTDLKVETIKEPVQIEVNRNKPIIREPVKNYNLTVDMDLRTLSNLKASDYDEMLKNTALNGLGKALEDTEKKYKVNGLYLMGLACLESAYGKSKFARERNNLVGFNAVDSNPGKATYFSSKYECMDRVGKLLSEKYLTKGAVYFNGYSARAVDVRYCSDSYHADKIVKIVNKLKGDK